MSDDSKQGAPSKPAAPRKPAAPPMQTSSRIAQDSARHVNASRTSKPTSPGLQSMRKAEGPGGKK